MESNLVTFYQNPKVDHLFGFFKGEPIPTKQDKFKPIDVIRVGEDGKEEVLKNFYIKNPDSESVSRFHALIQELAKGEFTEGKKIIKPFEVEVILSISVTEKRFREVDVDNLAKSVLDGLNGIAFEDDCQVTTLICRKHIHPSKVNGILIGVTKLRPENQGFGEDIKLFSSKKWK